MSSPKAPKETPAQKAFEIEQRRALNKETVNENRKRKALSRGQLGAVTLLSGLDPVTGSAPGVGSSGGSDTGSGVLDGGTSSSAAPTRTTPNAVRTSKIKGKVN